VPIQFEEVEEPRAKKGPPPKRMTEEEQFARIQRDHDIIAGAAQRAGENGNARMKERLGMEDLGDIDFVADAKPKKLNTQDLANLNTVAKALIHEQARIEFYTKKLTEAKQAANKIEENDLPELMTSVGMTSFKLESGHTIEVKDIVSGSLSEPKREGGLKWLKANGHAGIIKHEFLVELPESVVKDVKKAAALKASMEKLGVKVVDKETVHPQTLMAWARERLKDPATAGFPKETLGIYVGRRATVKQPVKT
jgi:hypothetical protein